MGRVGLGPGGSRSWIGQGHPYFYGPSCRWVHVRACIMAEGRSPRLALLVTGEIRSVRSARGPIRILIKLMQTVTVPSLASRSKLLLLL